MNLAAVLTTVATLLVHKPVIVHCAPLPGHPWTGQVWGWSDMRKNIWLRHCALTAWGYNPAVVVFAHEMIHIIHPDWPHSRVYPASYRFAPRVWPVIERVERKK